MQFIKEDMSFFWGVCVCGGEGGRAFCEKFPLIAKGPGPGPGPAGRTRGPGLGPGPHAPIRGDGYGPAPPRGPKYTKNANKIKRKQYIYIYIYIYICGACSNVYEIDLYLNDSI